MDEERSRSEMQRAALWKWRWLGWRDSTPAFKASIALLCAAAAYLGTRLLLVMR